jgi:hypothetical protein
VCHRSDKWIVLFAESSEEVDVLVSEVEVLPLGMRLPGPSASRGAAAGAGVGVAAAGAGAGAGGNPGLTHNHAGECIVCQDSPANVTLVHGSTGHLCVCETCAASKDMPNCPICREVITARVRTFLCAAPT